jgi:hypothetical protein
MKRAWWFAVLIAGALAGRSAPMRADAVACDFKAYRPIDGLTAAMDAGALSIGWAGDGGQDVRLQMAVEQGVPMIRELAVRRARAGWQVVAAGARPDFRVVSGRRRMSNQQMEPLRGLGIAITPDVIDRYKWDAFWDAPLDVPGIEPGQTPRGNPPPDLPRSPSEIVRADARYQVSACSVSTRGARIEATFPGVQLGVFSGRLRVTVYRGTNLIRMEILAATDQPSVAYKYDAGLAGLPIDAGVRLVWRDTAGGWQEHRFGGTPNDQDRVLKTSNRLLMFEQHGAALAVFPPPHTFFWAREIETNLGYNWFRKNADGTFAFGIRQAEREESDRYRANFALYSAPPGTEQRMAVYLFPNAAPAEATRAPVLAFTHGDRFKPLPGYQVMAHHYHMDLGERLLDAGSLDADIPDLDAIRAAGVTIASQVSSVTAGRFRPDALDVIRASVEGARRHSDANFLVMPDQEFYGSPLGGHTDLLFSHPVYWNGRAAGQPFTESDPTFGTVYHVGSADDLMEMARREHVMINMPHPRTKGSTGFPDAVKDEPFFRDPAYQGVGFRWGMGLDLSETRLCDTRCLTLLDDMSNWLADAPGPPKYLLAITETRYKAPGDEVYAASPVNYVHLDTLPTLPDVSPVIDALARGDYFVTSGEVLIPRMTLEGDGDRRDVVADVEWTFPLEFVEIVWGDGVTTGRQIVSAADLPPFGRHEFRIPFDAKGRAWMRFAAWDSAGNGALAQPIKLAHVGR